MLNRARAGTLSKNARAGSTTQPGHFLPEGNMVALDLEDRILAGIAAFYAIVNILKEYLPLVFREMD
jgi:hypothetical protein